MLVFVLKLSYWCWAYFQLNICYERNNLGCSFLLIGTGRVDDISFFDCSSPFCFLLIEFHWTFSIFYNILTNYFYCSFILFFYGDMPSKFFLLCPLYFFHSHASLFCRLRLFLYLISFLLFKCASIWENTGARIPHFLEPYWLVPSFFAKLLYRNGRIVACQNLTIIIVLIGVSLIFQLKICY